MACMHLFSLMMKSKNYFMKEQSDVPNIKHTKLKLNNLFCLYCDDDENINLAVYNEHFGNNTIAYP